MKKKSRKDQLIQTNSNQIILIDNKSKLSKNVEINVNKNNNVIVVCIDPIKTDYNFNFLVPKDKKLNVLFYCLSLAKQRKFLFHFKHLKNSNLTFISKIFVNNDSKVILNTQVSIDKNSSRAVSDQQVQGYLFSDKCGISATPALLVGTNNIKAAHSINIGHFDANKIFYLQTKGIDKNVAIQMLIKNEISPLKLINDKQNYIYNIVYKTLKDML